MIMAMTSRSGTCTRRSEVWCRVRVGGIPRTASCCAVTGASLIALRAAQRDVSTSHPRLHLRRQRACEQVARCVHMHARVCGRPLARGLLQGAATIGAAPRSVPRRRARKELLEARGPVQEERRVEKGTSLHLWRHSVLSDVLGRAAKSAWKNGTGVGGKRSTDAANQHSGTHTYSWG